MSKILATLLLPVLLLARNPEQTPPPRPPAPAAERAGPPPAASPPANSSLNRELGQILERIERLEAQNRALAEELRALKQQQARLSPAGSESAAPAEASGRQASRVSEDSGAPSSAEEVLDIHGARIDEQAQSKVEASQRFPLRITGMALFNAFWNGEGAGGADNPTIAPLASGLASGGATWRQTVLGFKYHGPQAFWGGRVSGNLLMDFFAGANQPLNHQLRLRIASIEVDWKSRSLMVGQEKPLISLREPNSLAQVGVSPLTNAGNLWLWQPQARFEQRFQRFLPL
ncbi:MAG: hypothetical protein FJW37_02380 [Acidobacteria bacterium]|nr:hypothetical protein [Acidobacteriota bacterium]